MLLNQNADHGRVIKVFPNRGQHKKVKRKNKFN